MTPEQFAYWLQGFFEVQGVGTKDDMEGIHPYQARIIRDHLQLVFEKKTPQRDMRGKIVRDKTGGSTKVVRDPFNISYC